MMPLTFAANTYHAYSPLVVLICAADTSVFFVLCCCSVSADRLPLVRHSSAASPPFGHLFSFSPSPLLHHHRSGSLPSLSFSFLHQRWLHFTVNFSPSLLRIKLILGLGRHFGAERTPTSSFYNLWSAKVNIPTSSWNSNPLLRSALRSASHCFGLFLSFFRPP
ncbi:uncharacterized protein LOC129317332 [Prosopis cineraria]|uniref:uncharacterized protein LOC129317332 n=1 Tax=Prosopis cineraria TaxID=364024 RepID=UPI00240ED9A9|nr:uncharacterized protein LOC129317332 [Prosopis cineraria]